MTTFINFTMNRKDLLLPVCRLIALLIFLELVEWGSLMFGHMIVEILMYFDQYFV